MLRAKKRDGNEPEIVRALEALGCTVERLDLTDGPDLLVGVCGLTMLMEVKDPNGRNRIEPGQEEWHAWWRGHPVMVVRSQDDAIAQMQGAVRKHLEKGA